jgi:hypothetical protein
MVAPSVTATDDGTATAGTLLERLTAWPPAPAATFSVTVQVSVPAPLIDPFTQLKPLRTGCDEVAGDDDVEGEPVDGLLVTIGATHPSRFSEKGKARSAKTAAPHLLFLRNVGQ